MYSHTHGHTHTRRYTYTDTDTHTGTYPHPQTEPDTKINTDAKKQQTTTQPQPTTPATSHGEPSPLDSQVELLIPDWIELLWDGVGSLLRLPHLDGHVRVRRSALVLGN